MMQQYFINILWASKITLQVSCGAIIFGGLLGFLSSVIQDNGYLKYPINAWNLLLRGLPDIVVIFMSYYGVSASL